MNNREKTNYIPFIANRIREAKQMFAPKVKTDPNKMTVEIDPLKKPKLEGDDLLRHINDRKKGGPHKNDKDKRKNNPSRNNDGW